MRSFLRVTASLLLTGLLVSAAHAWDPDVKVSLEITLQTSPSGASVTLLGSRPQFLGASGSPLQLPIPRDRDTTVILRVHLDGYQDADVRIPTASVRRSRPPRLLPAEGPVALVPLSPLSPLRLALGRLGAAWLLLPLVLLGALGTWVGSRQWRLLQRHERLRRLGKMEDPDDSNVGKVLAGWLLVRRLGTGGYASVYEAVPWDTLDPASTAAVKVIDRDVATEAFRLRFAREVTVLRSLDHPAVVRIIDWHDGEALCIIMELVKGETLRERVDRGRLALAEAMALLGPVFDAVYHAHERGIIHHDLKPGNIMVTDRAQPRVLDFGAATAAMMARVTESGDSLGTPGYMAPEHYDGVRTDPRSDQYALGCILFEALTGRPVFEDADPVQRMASHIHRPPPRVSDVRPDISGAVSEVVDRMLAKKPAARFPTLEDAWRALLQASRS